MISVIIPNLHSPLIAEVVAALWAQTTLPAEMIVVGPDRHGLLGPRVTHLSPERSLAPAVARNLGARHAGGEWLLFIDADALAAPDLIARLLACAASGQRVIGGGVVQPVAAGYWTICDNLLSFAATLAETAPGPRAALPSLCLLLPRALFWEVGGFDERYGGAAGEDLALSLSLRARGETLWCASDARVVHQHSRSSARDVWGHLRGYGRATRAVQRLSRGTLASPLDRLPRWAAGALLACAPPLAMLDALRAGRPSRYAPGIAWGRLGWYWGLIETWLVEA